MSQDGIHDPAYTESSEIGDSGTKQRLLDAAVKIFAEKGFQATSIRAVTREAGTSLSAANYHFGSKEELLRAALHARARVINRRRLELLDRARVEAGGAVLSVESVIDSFIRPVFERQAKMLATGARPPGLAIRLYLDPPEVISKIRHEAFEPTNRRFVEALMEVLPDSSREKVELALRFVLGVIVFAVSELTDWDADLSSGQGWEQPQLESVVVFAAAGVRSVVSTEAQEAFGGKSN